MAISKGKIIKTAVLPGIYPRLKNLLGSGFGSLAYLIAIVYNTVRILPNNHRFLKKEAQGTYTVRQVLNEASNHIHYSLKNIDQIIIFFSVIIALLLFFAQFIVLFISFLIPTAQAQTLPTTISGFFTTPNPQEDIAFRMLDLVFGIPDLFGSKDYSEAAVHQALHSLFEFYSYGMLVVGSIIIIYYVVAVVSETAQSGVPFGQRFNKAWAPIRIILFFALLLPIFSGINGGQYIVLGAAKFGSGLASTGWLTYNENITTTLIGQVEKNIADPTTPDITHIPAFLLIAKTCQQAYQTAIFNPDELSANHINTGESGSETGIQAWILYEKKDIAEGEESSSKYGTALAQNITFQEIAAQSQKSDFSVVFGVKDTEAYPNYPGSIYPICGEMSYTITDYNEPGSALIHTAYYNLVKDTWSGGQNIDEYAKNYVSRYLLRGDARNLEAALPDKEYQRQWLNYIEEFFRGENGIVTQAVETQIAEGEWQVDQKLKDYGWGGAGIWYNKIALQNGALASAIQQAPRILSQPIIMERYRELIEIENKNIEGGNYASNAALQSAPPLSENFIGESEILSALNQVYAYWQGAAEQPKDFRTNNTFIDAVNILLGTEGLFKMCANADIHPLAQLSSTGKTMIESAIRSYIASGIFTIGSIIPNPFRGAAQHMASMFSSIASIGLLVGFILFYIIPFMPFLYFFFAVGGWVKGIFEAMVAVPLWALAHLRIDGDGIPGDAAIKGYYLIFEIFIRPILIVFGLLAALTIFTAMVKVLNDIFYIAISNASGHEAKDGISCFLSPEQGLAANGEAADQARQMRAEQIKQAQRGPIDEFFFTILYAIIVYLVGMACFKLIDKIPNDILRWFNAEVSSFNDDREDPAEGLIKYIALAGQKISGSGIQGLGSGLQGSMDQGIKFLR